MKVLSDLKCDCGFSTKVFYRKPSVYETSVGTFICSGCDSKLRYMIKSDWRKGKGNVNVRLHFVEISESMQMMMDEAAAERAATPAPPPEASA